MNRKRFNPPVYFALAISWPGLWSRVAAASLDEKRNSNGSLDEKRNSNGSLDEKRYLQVPDFGVHCAGVVLLLQV